MLLIATCLALTGFRLPVITPFLPALQIDAIATVGKVLSLLHLEGWTFTTIIYKFSGLM